MSNQEKKLNLYKLKGWKGYAREGWKKIAVKYDDIEWGEGRVKPVLVRNTPFKKTYKI